VYYNAGGGGKWKAATKLQFDVILAKIFFFGDVFIVTQ